MTDTRYPNESAEYREARDELLEEEQALVERARRDRSHRSSRRSCGRGTGFWRNDPADRSG